MSYGFFFHYPNNYYGYYVISPNLENVSICIWFSACTTNFQVVVNLIASKKAGNGKFSKPGFSDWRILVVVLFG